MKVKQNKLTPLLKYPGGKEKELSYILPYLPSGANNFYEPFVGGGAVFFSIDANKYLINDKSSELISLYEAIKHNDAVFIDKLKQIDHNWNILSSVISNHIDDIVEICDLYKENNLSKIRLQDRISEFVFRNAEEFNGVLRPAFNVGIDNFVSELIKSFKNKILRIKEIEKANSEFSKEQITLNIECAFKTAFYMHFRHLYNNVNKYEIEKSFETAIFFFIREYCYSSMFRYNSFGKFNVPYGGISYNKKSLDKKIKYFSSPGLIEHLNKAIIEELDFYEFMKKHPPSKNDFIFIDPPYDTDFSTYAKNTFNQADQVRLAKYLKEECDGYFMIVIKDTPLIRTLYKKDESVKNNRSIKIAEFDKKYVVSFQGRNDADVVHLVITNY